MSGKWAKACDSRIETHGIDEGWGLLSAEFIVDALIYDRHRLAQVHRVEVAGLHIRTWRKSLDWVVDGTGRLDVPDGVEQQRLLWTALSCVASAEGTGNLAQEVLNLRQAEANLRTWWKRAYREEQ